MLVRGRSYLLFLHTFPTAASPSSTSLTLLLGLGCAEASAMVKSCEGSDSNFAGYVVADEVP